jgi:hypothetical protein
VKQYTVIWWEAADEELARLWLASPNRLRITEASREIDRLLSMQGAVGAEEVHEGLYALEIEPLRVQFSFEHDDRIIRVWTVRLVNP